MQVSKLDDGRIFYNFEAREYQEQQEREREKINSRLDAIESQQRQTVNRLTLVNHQLDTIDNHLVAAAMSGKVGAR